MNAQTTTTGIATIKPKRKYVRKAKVVQIKPKVRNELPKTARAYLRTLGMAADKEGTAIKELIKMHSDLVKRGPEYKTITLPTPTPAQPSLWQRFKEWISK